MTNNQSLTSKTAIVTGAGRGIGRATALMLAAYGARVCANDINPASAQKTAGAIVEAGGAAMAFHASADNKMAMQTMFQEVIERWDTVDMLVTCAGIEPESNLLEQGEWEWARTFDVNVKATFLCVQIAARVMRELGGGVMVTMSGSPGYPPQKDGYAAVAASKAAVTQFTRNAARELAQFGIRVNGIAPGYIKTPLTEPYWDAPGIRWGEPDDVARVAAFLCSDAARFINGQIIAVDGGQLV